MPRLHLAPGSHYCHPMSALSDSGLTLIDMGLSANRLPRNQKKCMINICSILSHSNGNLLNFGGYFPHVPHFPHFPNTDVLLFLVKHGQMLDEDLHTKPHSVPNEVKYPFFMAYSYIIYIIYSYSIRDVILLKV